MSVAVVSDATPPTSTVNNKLWQQKLQQQQLVERSVVDSNTKWQVYFEDNFNRPNGAPGSNWTTPIGGQPAVYINNNQLCGAGQSIGLLSFPINFETLRFAFNFTSISTTGFETYVVGVDNQEDIWFTGCDGGYQGLGFCQPSVNHFNVTSFAGTPVAMSINTEYFFEVMWSTTYIQFNLYESGQLLATVVESNPIPDRSLVNYGVIIGRDSTPSCISNFVLEVSQ